MRSFCLVVLVRLSLRPCIGSDLHSSWPIEPLPISLSKSTNTHHTWYFAQREDLTSSNSLCATAVDSAGSLRGWLYHIGLIVKARVPTILRQLESSSLAYGDRENVEMEIRNSRSGKNLGRGYTNAHKARRSRQP